MGQSVLIVEDEALIRDLCAEVFRDAGYEVIEAENGDQAMVVLHERPVAAIISDIRMPGAVDGLALRREVERSWPHTKMVLTSGHMVVERSEMSQNHVFVAKPYRFLDLVRRLDGMLGGAS